MMRYTYNRQVEPPAPFVHVSLNCLETGNSLDNLPALVDTAADRTVIPGGLVGRLALVPLARVPRKDTVSMMTSPRRASELITANRPPE
jgi:hypothetical protein